MVEILLATIGAIICAILAIAGTVRYKGRNSGGYRNKPFPKEGVEQAQRAAKKRAAANTGALAKPGDNYNDAVDRVVGEGRRRAGVADASGAETPYRKN